MKEFEAIQAIREKLKSQRHPDLLLGIGDDAAVFGKKDPWLITTDHIAEGVHFDRSASLEQIATKLIRSNISDLAAMGAYPVFALTNAALPPEKELPSAWKRMKERLIKTHLAELSRWKTCWIGGDTTNSGTLVLGMTMIGRPFVKGFWARRSGAKVGDAIFVTGKLGGSIQGRQFSFLPRLAEAEWLVKNLCVHSMMDISDGVASDLRHIQEESRVGALLFESALPVSKDAVRLSKKTGKPPEHHALCDGEDFELLFTLSPHEAGRLSKFPFPCRVTQVGVIRPAREGFKMQGKTGEIRPFIERGLSTNKRAYNSWIAETLLSFF